MVGGIDNTFNKYAFLSTIFDKVIVMIIIVEGIDRVGKTTLCNMLNEKLGIAVFKDDICESMKKKDAETKSIAALNAMKSIVNVCSSLKANLVIDRFHATEAVYGCINRGINKYTSTARFIETQIKIEEAMNGEFLYVFVKPIDLKMSEEKHGESLSKHEEMFEMLYCLIPENNRISVDFNSLDDALKEVEKRVRKNG